MNEEHLINCILSSNDKFEISIADDLHIFQDASGKYMVRRNGVGPPPNYESIKEEEEAFDSLNEAVNKFISLRNTFKIGQDYDHLRMINDEEKD